MLNKLSLRIDPPPPPLVGGFPCFLHSIYCSIPKKGQDFLDFIFKFLFPRISLQGFFYANLDAHATKLIILNKSVLYNHYFCIYIYSIHIQVEIRKKKPIARDFGSRFLLT